jgi:hypothetical protein
MLNEIEQKNKMIDCLTNVAHEINEQIVLGRGIYLVNNRAALCYVFEAITDYINKLSEEEETLREENENIADNILDIFGKMEELKHD